MWSEVRHSIRTAAAHQHNMLTIEQISYECEKSWHMARSWHSIKEIFLTNHTVRKHFSSNQNARTRYRHSHGMARPYRNFFTVIRNLL
jgi:hypothetical protein